MSLSMPPACSPPPFPCEQVLCEQRLMRSALSVPLQTVQLPIFERAGVDVSVRRDDLIHSALSGNKYYKLFFNLQQARAEGYDHILSFGGAWSNHIHALSALGAELKIKTTGIIRGERPKTLSATLKDAENNGMQLIFISRRDYRDKSAWLERNSGDLEPFYMVPEGGSNLLGARGCKVLGQALRQQIGACNMNVDAVLLPVASGGTLAGIASGMGDMPILGVQVIKGEGSLAQDVKSLTAALSHHQSNWQIIDHYHAGGYARFPNALRQFMLDFEQVSQLRVDPVYGIKVWWALTEMLKQQYWPRGSELVVVHTGGLQGRRGFSGLYDEFRSPFTPLPYSSIMCA